MKLKTIFILLFLFAAATLSAQIKIGDNPQLINPSSLLELESTDKTFVLTRINTIQMDAIVNPTIGALVYNTDENCVFQYRINDDKNIVWENLCEAFGDNFDITNVPMSHGTNTINVTRTPGTNIYNIEVDNITGLQITDQTINGEDDIQDTSITSEKLQDGAVGPNKIQENAISDLQLDKPSISISGFAPATENLSLGSYKITNLDEPTDLQDAATKNYVDNATSALGTLSNGTIYVGDNTNTAQETTISGDILMDNIGLVTIQPDVINNIKILNETILSEDIFDGTITTSDLADDVITLSKLAHGNTDKQIMQWDATANEWIFVNTSTIPITESDGIIGNEITDVTNTTLTRSGMGTAALPYTLAVSTNGVTTAEILNETILSEDILNGTIATVDIANDAIDKDKIAADVAGLGLTQNTDGSLEIDPTTITGDGDITSTDITVGNGTNAAFEDVTLEITDDAVTALKINADVAGTGLAQNADGSLEIDPTTITGDGDITSTDITVGNGTNAAFEDVTLEITDDAVTALKINADVAGTGISQAADGSLEIAANGVTTAEILNETILSEDILNGTIATIDVADDAIDKDKIAADIAGTGLTQNTDGSLEIDPTTITGDGDITSTDITVGNGTNAAFEDVTLTIADDAVTALKINADVAGTGISQAADGSLEIAANGVTTAEILNETILSEDILNGTIATVDIANDAVTTDKIINANVTPVKIAPSTKEGEVLTTVAGTVAWQAPAVVAMGMVNRSATINPLRPTKEKGAVTTRTGTGFYTVTFNTGNERSDRLYTIQLTLLGASSARTIRVFANTSITAPNTTRFLVETTDSAGARVDSSWYYTVTDF